MTACPPIQHIARLRIGLDVDPALADWLRAQLLRHWPRLECVAAGPCDLRVCYERPPGEPACPTLWIAEIERRPHLVRLSPRLWRLSAPFTPARLKRILDEILE